jgi:ankyrin repeat protein
MHWAAEQGHLSALKLLGEQFTVWTEADKFGRNALHCAALGGHKDCAFWLVRNASDASQFLSLTLVRGRCWIDELEKQGDSLAMLVDGA